MTKVVDASIVLDKSNSAQSSNQQLEAMPTSQKGSMDEEVIFPIDMDQELDIGVRLVGAKARKARAL